MFWTELSFIICRCKDELPRPNDHVDANDDDDELEFNDASTLLGHKRHQG